MLSNSFHTQLGMFPQELAGAFQVDTWGATAPETGVPASTAPPAGTTEAGDLSGRLAALQTELQTLVRQEQRWTSEWEGFLAKRSLLNAELRQIQQQLAEPASMPQVAGQNLPGDTDARCRQLTADVQGLELVISHWQQRAAELQAALEATQEELDLATSDRLARRAEVPSLRDSAAACQESEPSRLPACAPAPEPQPLAGGAPRLAPANLRRVFTRLRGSDR